MMDIFYPQGLPACVFLAVMPVMLGLNFGLDKMVYRV